MVIVFVISIWLDSILFKLIEKMLALIGIYISFSKYIGLLIALTMNSNQ